MVMSRKDQAYAKTATATAATARPELTIAAVSGRKLEAPLDLLLEEEELWLEELAEEVPELPELLLPVLELEGEAAELEDEPEEEEPDELDEPPVVAAEPSAAAEPFELRHEVSVPARTVTSAE